MSDNLSNDVQELINNLKQPRMWHLLTGVQNIPMSFAEILRLLASMRQDTSIKRGNKLLLMIQDRQTQRTEGNTSSTSQTSCKMFLISDENVCLSLNRAAEGIPTTTEWRIVVQHERNGSTQTHKCLFVDKTLILHGCVLTRRRLLRHCLQQLLLIWSV